MQRIITLTLSILFTTSLFGQMKPVLPKTERAVPLTPENVEPPQAIRPGVPKGTTPFAGTRTFSPIGQLPKPVKNQLPLKAYISLETGTPYLIEGNLEASPNRSLEAQVHDYLDAVQPVLKMDDPAAEFSISRSETDEIGYTHIRLSQYWQGLRVYGAEAVLQQFSV